MTSNAQDMNLGAVMDVLANHFAGRRDALNAVAQHGNRFEDWFKWEALIALHNALLVDPKPWFSCAGVERSETATDVFIGLNVWTFNRRTQSYAWPARSDEDVWLELKARSTWDKGASELAAQVGLDITKLKRGLRNGRRVAAAMILQYPGEGDAAKMAEETEEELGRASFRRTIYDHSLNAASHVDDTTLTVAPKALAILLAWLVQ